MHFLYPRRVILTLGRIDKPNEETFTLGTLAALSRSIVTIKASDHSHVQQPPLPPNLDSLRSYCRVDHVSAERLHRFAEFCFHSVKSLSGLGNMSKG